MLNIYKEAKFNANMKFEVFRTSRFEKEFFKLSKTEQTAIAKFEKKLAENPYAGKPLGYIFFREKKLNGRRIYYLVYEKFVIVLMVAVSDKKTQQATIDAIKQRLDEYYNFVRETLRKL